MVRARISRPFRIFLAGHLATLLTLSFPAQAGDILRGGATASSARRNAAARANAGAEQAVQAKANAKDRLARTAQAIQAVTAMQTAARSLGANNLGPDPNRPGFQLPDVPDGLGPGGLDLQGAPVGANAPTQSGNKVTIRQTAQQAILNWKTFNVGKKTSLYFDQRQGGAGAGQWIAFNKVSDPSGSPSQIMGSIKAEGQVYIINQNGIIFGPGSQVNARTLVASSLPINDNLITNGLLNNRDAQFLFSALPVPGGADGTPDFNPPPPLTPSGRHGDVTVLPGAVMASPVSADGNGGRIMLVGANVTNSGILSTPSGQTILAAGLQVGIQAHAGNDPSLRGLDVWIGDVGNYAGAAANNGLIEALTGNIMMAGRQVSQRGVLESSTSVNLNGRIDLLASYGAVANPSFDNTGGGGPPFLSQFTGEIKLGEGSVIRVLPDYLSPKTIPGKLAQKSQVNLQGFSIRLEKGAIILAPSGDIRVRAGIWPYKDADGNRTTLAADGSLEPGLSNFFQGTTQRFLLSGGQILLDEGSLIDASGSTEVLVPLLQHIFAVQLRGPELADSPLQRAASLKGVPLIVDVRRTGIYHGREWVGTPLGDLTEIVAVIQRNIAQLTAAGGSVSLEAGGAIVTQPGSIIDVSGGYFLHEGGRVQTTRLMRGRHILDIEDAIPDVLYDGVYEGRFTTTSAKWGITRRYAHPLAPLGAYDQQEYLEGAAGGSINLSAPSMALGGELVGRTVKGPRQLDAPPELGSLKLAFRAEKQLTVTPSDIRFVPFSPTPPEIIFADGGALRTAEAGGGLFAVDTALYEDEGGGFGHLEVENLDGNVLVPRGTKVNVPARGSLTVRAANVTVEDDIIAPGGEISLTAYNFSPFTFQELQATGALNNVPAPLPVEGRGLITVQPGVRLSVAGMIVDDRPTSPVAFDSPRVLDAGAITLEGYSILLPEGSVLDASGGVWARPAGGFAYGAGGEIAILAGRDPDLATTIGGKLELGATLLGYSGGIGGSLSIQANLIQVGGSASSEDTLVLQPDFFRRGGFTKYSLTGIGARMNGEYLPAVRISAGTVIEPVAENWLVVPFREGEGTLGLRPFLKPRGLRPPTSLEFSALGADDTFTETVVEALGLIVFEEGSRILTDPGASVTVDGDAVAIFGTIEAPGGLIAISGRDEFRLPSELRENATFALPTVYLGPSARLSAAGTPVLLPDPFGRRSGIVYPGGVISISGNIVAEAGAVLDVSGASAVLDFHPSRLALADSVITIPRNSGLTAGPWGRLSVPVRVDSDGGLIELHGSQMLYSDATLLGRAGGPGALGGFLSISSGRFYEADASRTGADINLIVEQSGNALDFGAVGGLGRIADLMAGRANLGAMFAAGSANPGIGYFAIDRFNEGGFDSLDLGFEYFADATPIPYGGNVEFRGPVTINARGFVRLAGGGALKADAPVTINARYVAIGQEFRPPLNPGDPFFPFQQDPIPTGETRQYFLPPTFGPGDLAINANLIDIGTLSLQNIGRAHFSAPGGDIRGNGTLDIAGDLVLTAAQVYPTTLAAFNIFAYDHAGGPGSVTIAGSGVSAPPLSAGGSLSIFASIINQGGVLRAPLGSITLGWDGTDFDPSDADLDPPFDPLANGKIAVPVAERVTLESGSLTSVSAIDLAGREMLIPFGLSPDGLSWIDPRGVNITVSGLPEKRVSIAGDSVVTQPGSVIDIRGGGDLYAFRWVPGVGGSADILGTPSADWSASDEYEAGDLVRHGGRTWSARTGMSPGDFAGGIPEPKAGRYWTLVPESFAVIPGFDSRSAPYAAFNTGANAGLLDGDPGYVGSGLRLGDQIFLRGVPGLPAGNYTLLPARYALLPGAFLVTPQETAPIGTLTLPEGSSYVSGYRFNGLHRPAELSPLLSRYEVAPAAVVRGRAEYDDYFATSFLSEAASRLGLDQPQRLPIDAGYLSFHGNAALNLQGNVLAGRPDGGRGAMADISSFADIYVVGEGGGAPAGAAAVLEAGLLNSWGIESLLIGGQRRRTEAGTVVDVRTSHLILDNPGSVFSAPEIILASREELTLTPGASIGSSGGLSQPAETLLITGDGTLLRVSGDIRASIMRNSLTNSTAPFMAIGAGANIFGTSVILDSTYATSLDPAANLSARALTLGSGQISLVFGNASGVLAGSVIDPHLVLAGDILRKVQDIRLLTLQSYRTIDLYGTDTFGGESLERLRLLAGGLRGYEQGAGTVVFAARDVLFDNPINVAGLPAPAGPLGGELRVNADVVRLGSNAFAVSGYDSVVLDAAAGIFGQGIGSFSTQGRLTALTPLITGARGSTHAVTALGDLALLGAAGAAGVEGGLGAGFTFTGASVVAETDILLPSGQLTLQATAGDVTVGGELSVAGTFQNFYDLVRYADAGQITLKSDTGNVTLQNGSLVSVAAAAEGGNAGLLSISTPAGAFVSDGTLLGGARAGYRSGSFFLDAGSIVSFADANDPLNAGGFLHERNFRVRSGDVLVDGVTRVRNFTLSADQGGITVTGLIDASGETGGKIALSARDSLTLTSAARLTAAGEHFSNAGKGGEIHLEAGAQRNGAVNLSALLDIQAGSEINLSVADFVAGDYTTPGSSAFFGKFAGTLHLRAPRNGNDVNVNTIAGSVLGASSVLVEGYRLYDRTGIGTLDNALRETINTDNANYLNAGYAAMRARLLGGNPDPSALASVLVIAPGVEIINRTGNLTLGAAADSAANDWNLASFRYGPQGAAGVLTLRAAGNLVFLNALSDGFNSPPAGTPAGQQLWLSRLMTINPLLPVNTQSWSYRLTAGADLGAADFQRVLPVSALAADAGSLLLGKFYSPTIVSGANTTTAAAVNNRYQVIRTGSGDIDINVGRDVQLRNQFATIYTAGVGIADPTRIFAAGDFVRPIVDVEAAFHPNQGTLGGVQQSYPAQWSMAGGNVTVSAQGNIGRYTSQGGNVISDSSAQLPVNWLYRRGFVDPATGLFGVGGVDTGGPTTVIDDAASTAWWIDFSNFFQGIGALGGGDIGLFAGQDIINVDAVIPTNARMPGHDPLTGLNVAPNADKLVEYGGGDLTVRTGGNIDGGVYYVERGRGDLFAGGSITTNKARSPSLGILRTPEEVGDPLTWLPTTLFLGKGSFVVGARRDILLGPVANPFLLPAGLNNKFWYKTYFHTFDANSSVDVTSIGGGITHRQSANLDGQTSAKPILVAWMEKKNLFQTAGATSRASNWQPWIRLAETNVAPFGTLASLMPPTLRSTAFAGDINITGAMTLFPAPAGTLELAALGGIVGLQPAGVTMAGNPLRPVTAWTSATVNVSDADPALVPGIASPFAYQSVAGRAQIDLRQTSAGFLSQLNALFSETGSYLGNAGSIETKKALHAAGLLHARDPEPVRIYAGGGDITGLTLFTPKAAQVMAERDITDVSLYLQNVDLADISIVSAGRDIIPNNANAPRRSLANDLAAGNAVVDAARATVTGALSNALAGDIQINGPGYLEVLAGRNLDLGTGANFTDGTGTGITSIGNSRNPFLPFTGASIIAMAGVGGRGGGPALGLSGSILNLEEFGAGGDGNLSEEQQAILALEEFYAALREAGRQHSVVGNYDLGFAAIQQLLGGAAQGDIFTRARDIRTASGGSITIAAPGGALTMASDIFGNPFTPPGIVTEYGGAVSLFTQGDVDIGRARIFTLRGGDLSIWSSAGNIAAGNAAKTVVTAPPTRVIIDATTADIQTDLGGLATGGGIGVLASVEGVEEGDVLLMAPNGEVDAGDAGIRATGNITIAAPVVRNADNISAGGGTVGVPVTPVAAAPNIAGLAAASTTTGASTSALEAVAQRALDQAAQDEETPSIITVDVIDYGPDE